MGQRLSLQTELETLLGSTNVYFQPPPSIMLSYPCIIYEQDNIKKRNANNNLYKKDNRYSLTFITRDPDSPIIDSIIHLPKCSFDRHMVIDNLHHYIYTIFY